MKKIFILAIMLIPVVGARAAVDFNDYFIDKTLRIDFYMTGNFNEEIITTDQMYQLGFWAGNPKNLIFPFNLGDHAIKVYSKLDNKLIFSKGFGCIFSEYKTTGPARKGEMKTFHETAMIPFPKAPITFVIEARDRQNIPHPIYTETIYPSDANIIKDKPNKTDRIYESMINGSPHDKVDFVFVAEGYTAEEWDKFKKDVDRYRDVIFSTEPYKSNRNKFNIYGAFRASSESGVDEPRQGRFRNTAISASYNALALDRYLLVDDLKAMKDIACNVPYDYIIAIANTTRYGGGGIAGNYTIFTSDNATSSSILMHEFGHAFAFLADEYYDATVSYEDFFERGVEPLEANITALLDPSNVKWKDLLTPGIPVPTPWGKEETEALQAKQQENNRKMREEISVLQDVNAPIERIQQVRQSYQDKNNQIRQQISQIRKENQQKWAGKVGVFEGAGYSSKGLYRSEITIDFFSAQGFRYGLVSQKMIKDIIDYYSN